MDCSLSITARENGVAGEGDVLKVTARSSNTGAPLETSSEHGRQHFSASVKNDQVGTAPFRQ